MKVGVNGADSHFQSKLIVVFNRIFGRLPYIRHIHLFGYYRN